MGSVVQNLVTTNNCKFSYQLKIKNYDSNYKLVSFRDTYSQADRQPKVARPCISYGPSWRVRAFTYQCGHLSINGNGKDTQRPKPKRTTKEEREKLAAERCIKSRTMGKLL